jgi:hypothetical protein
MPNVSPMAARIAAETFSTLKPGQNVYGEIYSAVCKGFESLTNGARMQASKIATYYADQAK